MHQTSMKVCAPAHAECRGSKPEHPRGCRRQCPPRVGCLASWPEPIVQSLCLVIPPTFFGSRCMRVASLSHICPLSPTAPEPTDHISPQGHIVLHQSRTHQGYKEATVSPDSRDQSSFPFPHPTPNSDTTHNDDVACIFTSSYIHRLYIGPHSQARGSVYTTCRARPAPARPTPVPETGEEDGQAGSETRQESTARRPDTGHEYTTRLPDSGIMIHFGGHLSWVQPTWVIIERTIFYIVWSICIGLLTIWIPFFAVCLFKVLRSLL